MPLSDHDRRILAELERQLAAGAPSSDGRSKPLAAVRRQLGALTGAVGFAFLIVGLLLEVASSALVGALLVASWIVAPLRRRLWEAEGWADDG
jgi:Flp pilus assembly protein TadB